MASLAETGSAMTASTKMPGLLTVAAVVVAAVAGAAATSYFRPDLPRPSPIITPMISLEKMGQMVSLRVNYSDVIEFSEKSAIDMPFNREIRLGSTRALLVAKGDCTIGTDLTHAKYENIDIEKHVLTVVLNMPQALSVRISHDSRDKGGSYFYSINEHGLAAFIGDQGKRTKAADSALAKAQSDLARVCLSAPNLASARQNAEAVLRSMYIATGWTPAFVWAGSAVAQ
jgi:hypothetical protein